MVRIWLTLYLTLVTAAGPCLCCCSLARLFVAPPADTTATPCPRACCCGQSEAAADETCDGEQQTLDSHAPTAPHEPCPCKEGRGDGAPRAAAPRPAGEVGEALAQLCPLESDPTVRAADLVLRGQGVRKGAPLAFPCYTPRGVLRALHILLC